MLEAGNPRCWKEGKGLMEEAEDGVGLKNRQEWLVEGGEENEHPQKGSFRATQWCRVGVCVTSCYK